MEKRKLKLKFVLFEAGKGEEEIIVDDEDLPEFPGELKEFIQEEEDDVIINSMMANSVYEEEKEIGIKEFENVKDYYFEPSDVKEILGESELVRKFRELKEEGRPVFVVPFIELPGCDCDSCNI